MAAPSVNPPSGSWTDAKTLIPIIVSLFSLGWNIVSGVLSGRNRARDRAGREYDSEVRTPINTVLGDLDSLRNEIKALGRTADVNFFGQELKKSQDNYNFIYDRLIAAVEAGDNHPKHNGLLKLTDLVSLSNDDVLDRFNDGFNAKTIADVATSITKISKSIETLRVSIRDKLSERSDEIFGGK